MKTSDDDAKSRLDPFLKEDTERLHFAMKAAGVGIWELDPKTNDVIWDERCRELFGLNKDNSIPYAKAIQYIHKDDLEKVTDAVKKALSGEDDGKYDVRYRTIGEDDGKLRWVHFSGQAYFGDHGEVLRFGGIAEDITTKVTEEIKSSQKIEESQKTLNDALELAQLATWSLDVATGKTEFSERMKSWLGIDVYGRSLNTGIDSLPDHERERVKSAILQAMSPGGGGIFDLEYAIINQQTNRQRVIHSQARTFFDDEGKAVKMMGVAQDITDHRNIRLSLEQEVQQRTEELDAANDELKAINDELQTINAELAAMNGTLELSNENLQQFAHVASHDLKEPIRKIKTFLSMIEGDPDTTLSLKTQTLMDRVYAATERMYSMINGVLSYSTINATGHLTDKIDLQKIVEEIILDLEIMITEKNANVTATALPVIEGAEILIYQLFSNLIINSLKFSRPDNLPIITISGSLKNFDDKEFVEITVQDNGLGFPNDQSEQIFNMFTRLHSKDKYEGTGLGLSLCRKIVERHDGTITANGERNKGATFVILLPLRQSDNMV